MKQHLAVAVCLAVAGAAVGALWAWVAPPAHGVVAVTKSGNRIHDYLGAEADHFFDGAMMMFGLLVTLAVVSAVLAWQFRTRRGPAMVAALTIGCVAAAGAAVGIGAALTRIRYGRFDVEAVPADHKIHYFTEAPSTFFGHSPLQLLLLLVLPAGVAALVYGVLAAVSAHDDLGVELSRRPRETAAGARPCDR